MLINLNLFSLINFYGKKILIEILYGGTGYIYSHELKNFI